MSSYTFDELIKIMEPQAQQDKALINQCIGGLGLYAAQIYQSGSNTSKVDEMRNLVDKLVCYWGLDEGEHTPSLDDFISAFDERISEAKSGAKLETGTYRHQADTIYGLHRFGKEMVVAQGDGAMSDILDMGDLMEEISIYWDFQPYEAIHDLAEKLRGEVQGMLESISLPGQQISGMNSGYELKQAILFDNNKGFALAHNPDAPTPFVTWQFTEDNGTRDYYWGKYCMTEERAKISYLSRTTDHLESFKVMEKLTPLDTVEVNAEKKFREDVLKADITDEQTHKEIRDPMPEIPTDEAITDNQGIPVQILSKGQPVVTVTSSEDEQLRSVIEMPLYLANTVFFESDEKQKSKYFAALHSTEPIAQCLKTDFTIDFIMNGKSESYSGQYNIGDGDGTLIEHIQGNAEYYRSNEDHQKYLESKGEKEITNAQYDTILNELVPFFEKHCELSRDATYALSELMGIHEATAGNPSDSEKARIESLESIMDNTWRFRDTLNIKGLDSVLELQQSAVAKNNEDKSVCGEKPSVIEKIKAAQKSARQTTKPKQERNKKQHGSEL